MSIRLNLFAAAMGLAASPAPASSLENALSYARLAGLKSPVGPLAVDGSGAIYGAAYYGGSTKRYAGYGAVFKLTPPAPGQAAWGVETIFVFDPPTTGLSPNGVAILDGSGALYGTASGPENVNGALLYRLTPPASGQGAWSFTPLFDGFGGLDAFGPLLLGPDGAIYSTLPDGGPMSDGEIVRVAPPASGQGAWTGTVLYTFTGQADGRYVNGLTADADFRLYGTTADYGLSSAGTVFSLTPPAASSGVWTHTVLHTLQAPEGEGPTGPLLRDHAGALYTAVYGGGSNLRGTVLEVSPPGAGQTYWSAQVLHNFTSTDGQYPDSLAWGPGGIIFGLCNAGGATYNRNRQGWGDIFSLAPPSAGTTAWTESVLLSFMKDQGSQPASLVGNNGSYFGVTSGHTAATIYGTVFRFVP